MGGENLSPLNYPDWFGDQRDAGSYDESVEVE